MGGYRFGAYTLDTARYVPLRGEEEIALRPKAFDVLKHLVERAGTTVTKDELFDAVWDGAARTDGSLVQCIKHIREALGDTDHQIVRTVPRRGYLLAAEVSATGAADGLHPPAAPPRQPPRAQTRPPFPRVGRPVAIGAAGLAALVLAAGAAWTWIAGDRDPAKAAHYAILARAVMDRERSANANREGLTLYGKALAHDPDHVSALIGYAQVLLTDHIENWSPRGQRAARLDQAEAAIERAVALDPTNADAYYYRGMLWRARGDPARAIAAVQQALALHPTHAWARAELGRSQINAGRFDEAVRDIETALRLSPDEPRKHVWYFWAGLAAIHAGKYEAAVNWLLKARAEGRRRPRLMLPALAVAYAGLGREDEARPLMAEHLVQMPGLTVSDATDRLTHRGAAVAPQRERIAALLRRLGLPEGGIHTSDAGE